SGYLHARRRIPSFHFPVDERLSSVWQQDGRPRFEPCETTMPIQRRGFRSQTGTIPALCESIHLRYEWPEWHSDGPPEYQALTHSTSAYSSSRQLTLPWLFLKGIDNLPALFHIDHDPSALRSLVKCLVEGPNWRTPVIG